MLVSSSSVDLRGMECRDTGGFVCIRRSSVKIVPRKRLGELPSDERCGAVFLACLYQLDHACGGSRTSTDLGGRNDKRRTASGRGSVKKCCHGHVPWRLGIGRQIDKEANGMSASKL